MQKYKGLYGQLKSFIKAPTMTQETRFKLKTPLLLMPYELN